MTQAFPLQWPHGRPRTKPRTQSSFRVKPGTAYLEMMDELGRFGVTGIVVSSNIPLRMDGTPYRDGLTDPLEDPGIAVYFTKRKRQVCLPCDTYRRPWEHIRAIGKAVEALRAMERHGATQILDQAFTGFMALPAPEGGVQVPWWDVLGVPRYASEDQITAAYKAKARAAGGASVELNRAKEDALAGIG